MLAAGPDLYEVSAGRSLGYLENVLDVLACLQPCGEPPFEVLAEPLLARLARLTTIVAVVLDWDEKREAFLRSVRRMGVAEIFGPGATMASIVDWVRANVAASAEAVG